MTQEHIQVQIVVRLFFFYRILNKRINTFQYFQGSIQVVIKQDNANKIPYRSEEKRFELNCI